MVPSRKYETMIWLFHFFWGGGQAGGSSPLLPPPTALVTPLEHKTNERKEIDIGEKQEVVCYYTIPDEWRSPSV